MYHSMLCENCSTTYIYIYIYILDTIIAHNFFICQMFPFFRVSYKILYKSGKYVILYQIFLQHVTSEIKLKYIAIHCN